MRGFLSMNNSDLILDIEKLIDYSKYYLYKDQKKYNSCVEKLIQLKNHIEDDDISKCIKKGGYDSE